MLNIRNETPADYQTVEDLTRRAFYNLYVPGCHEHYLVHVMRDHPDFVPELDFVLERDGEIIGSILYTRSTLTSEAGERREALVQTIDLPVTLLRFFQIPVPKDMLGKDLGKVLQKEQPVLEAALFGIHGGMLCCTDGRYVLMKAPDAPENQPLYEYTMMPTHMASFFSEESLRSMKWHAPFSFTKGAPVMQMEPDGNFGGGHGYGDLLFDLQADPSQKHPIEDEAQKARLEGLMAALLKENDAPPEQFERLGL